MRISDWSSDVCSSDLAKEGRREVLAKLFADGPELDLDNSNATTIGGARLLHAKLLKKRFTPRMFKRNGGSIGIGFAIALLSMAAAIGIGRSEEHTSELPSLMRISYAVFCLTHKTDSYVTHSPTVHQ